MICMTLYSAEQIRGLRLLSIVNKYEYCTWYCYVQEGQEQGHAENLLNNI